MFLARKPTERVILYFLILTPMIRRKQGIHHFAELPVIVYFQKIKVWRQTVSVQKILLQLLLVKILWIGILLTNRSAKTPSRTMLQGLTPRSEKSFCKMYISRQLQKAICILEWMPIIITSLPVL